MDYPATWRKIDDLCALMDKSRAKMVELRLSIIGKALREGTNADKIWALGIKREEALKTRHPVYTREGQLQKQLVAQLDREITELRGGGS